MEWVQSLRIVQTMWDDIVDDISLENVLIEKGEGALQFTIPKKPVIVYGKSYRTTRINVQKAHDCDIDLLRLDDRGLSLMFGDHRTIIISFIFGGKAFKAMKYVHTFPKAFLTTVSRWAFGLLGIHTVVAGDDEITSKRNGQAACASVIDTNNILTHDTREKMAIISAYDNCGSFCGHVIINARRPLDIYPFMARPEPHVIPLSLEERLGRTVYNQEVVFAFINAFRDHGLRFSGKEIDDYEYERLEYWRGIKYRSDQWNYGRWNDRVPTRRA